MAPTTLPGQWSTTSPNGRSRMEGAPLKVAEIMAGLDGAAYVERTALYSTKLRARTKKAIKKVLKMQMEGRGLGFVEVLSECPTHLKMTPVETENWVKECMVPHFPLGVLKDETHEPWFNPPKPSFDADKVLEVLEAPTVATERFCTAFPSHIDPSDVALKFAGAGGDGAQTAAALVVAASINEGFDATHIPSYGPESRGGTSYADVHVAEDEVLSPASPDPHILVAFNAPSLAKFGPAVRPGGTVLYDSSVINDVPEFAEGVRVLAVPCSEIARSLGKVVVKNIVALGALQEATGLLTEDSLLTVVRLSLQKKCAMIPINEEAWNWGVRAIREGLTEMPS